MIGPTVSAKVPQFSATPTPAHGTMARPVADIGAPPMGVRFGLAQHPTLVHSIANPGNIVYRPRRRW